MTGLRTRRAGAAAGVLAGAIATLVGLGPAAAATASPAQAAAAQPSATSVALPLDAAAYYWREQSQPLPAAGVAPPSATDPTVPPGDVAVAAVPDGSGQPDKEAYLRLDTSGLVDAASVSRARLVVAVDPAAQQGFAASAPPQIVACGVTGSFPDSNAALPFDVKPTDDCTVKSLGTFDAAAAAYTFDITALVRRWIGGGVNSGIALAPANPAAVPPFQVTFGPRKAIAATASIVTTVVASAVPGGRSASDGALSRGTTTASAGTTVPPLPSAEVPQSPATAPVVAPAEQPVLATQAAPRLLPVAFHIRHEWPLVALVVAVTLALLTGCSLVMGAARPRPAAGSRT